MENLLSLEQCFFVATQRHEDLKYLDAQWKFDKELLSKALQNVSNYFPHYSRHDGSHSRKIITNIERLLGEKIKLLSATDMWLILEAAYCHDIGMVITEKQLEDLDDPSFVNFVQSIADDPDSENKEIAKEILENEITIRLSKDGWSKIEKYKFILAEWFRLKHPINSKKIVENPNEQIGLSSPRNELLPNRLFIILGDICRAHGQSFEETMSLSYSETGMAIENCHPRYIACLLRLADLLDIDDNRFCPVIIKSNIAGLPNSSHTHFKKHLAIRKYRFDSEKIEVKLVCQDYETFEISKQWFDWLEDEHLNQSRNWMNIVPNSKFGTLPILMKPEIKMLEPMKLLKGIENNRYELDHYRMHQILTSDGFYESKLDAVREILQNAVDSTLIMLWQKYISEHNFDFDENNAIEYIFDSANKQPINVDISIENEELILTVKDSGMGLTTNDLVNIFRPINRSINIHKNKLIEKMPRLIKPSGCFGIGIQSYFMLTDKIKILSRSRMSNEKFEIYLSKDNKGNSIQEYFGNLDYGVSIQMLIQIENIPKKINFIVGNEKVREKQIKYLSQYDIISKDRNLSQIPKFYILDKINQFQQHSLIEININNYENHKKTRNSNYKYYSSDTGVVLYDIKFGIADWLFDVNFKGQPVELKLYRANRNRYNKFAYISVDIAYAEASELITYNRASVLEHKQDELLNDKILKTCIAFIDEHIEDKIDESDKIHAQMFHFLFSGDSEYNKFKDDLSDYKFESVSMTLGELFNKVERNEFDSLIYIDNEYDKETIDKEVVIKSEQDFIIIINWFKRYYKDKFKNSMQEHLSIRKEDKGLKYKLEWNCKNNQIPFSKYTIERSFKRTLEISMVGNRKFFPACGKYSDLALDLQDDDWYRSLIESNIWSEKMLLPYTFSIKYNGDISFEDNLNFEEDLKDELVDWVHDKLRKKSVTKEMVIKLYRDLIVELNCIHNQYKN